MTGSLKHLGGDRWQVVLYAGRDVLGKERRVTRVVRAPSRRAASKLAIGVTKELQDRVDRVQSRRGTVGELADAWVRMKVTAGGSPATIDGVTAHIVSIKKHLGSIQATALTGEHVDAWLDVLRTERTRRPRSAATVHHYFATLRAILSWARRKRRIQIVATQEADPPRPVKYEHHPPTREVMLVVLAAAGGDFRVALELLAATGMRRGELVGLRWSDLSGTRLRIERALVEVDGGGVVVKLPKSGKPRTISLAPGTVETLEGHRVSLQGRGVTGEDAYIFPALRMAEDGSEPHRPTWVNLNWARIKTVTGVKFRPHDVRHWHASELLAAGVPLAVVSDRLGHTKQTTTLDLYSHVLDDHDDAAAAEVQRALGRG